MRERDTKQAKRKLGKCDGGECLREVAQWWIMMEMMLRAAGGGGEGRWLTH